MSISLSALWVEGSPKGELSLSSACAVAYLDAIRAQGIDVDLARVDVWGDDVPEVGRDAAIAKFARLYGDELTPAQREIWERIEATIADVRGRDLVVLSCPMWNWNVPHRVKAWIDVITQPGLSFTVDADRRDVSVLGVGRRCQLILTRSSAYDGRSPELRDHQQPYLEDLFGGLLGYELGETLVVEPTTAFDPERRQRIRDDAIARAAAAGGVTAQQLAGSVPGAAALQPDE